MRIGASELLEIHQPEESQRNLRPLLLRNPFHFQAKLDVSLGRSPGKELREILEHDAAVKPLACHSLPADQNFSFGRLQESGNNVEHRGFAASALAHNAQKFCGLDTEADILQRRHWVLDGFILKADVPQLDLVHNLKPEIRSSKSETNERFKSQLRNPKRLVWNFLIFDHLKLFRTSDFEFRICICLCLAPFAPLRE